MLRRTLALALALPLCGCDHTIEVGKCEYEAQKAFPIAKLVNSPDMGRMIKACMKANGYEFDLNLDKCSGNFEAEASPNCYRRS
jgi:hypothetical protein